MAGVGPGTAIGGRYALRTIVHRAPRGQRWAAYDTATGQDVAVLLVPGGTPVAAAVQDAARRAAVLDDPRLVPVTDVGDDSGYAYVVEQLPEDATTVRQLLDDGPLAPEEARRITGEASIVLERARQRGLHHQELTPEHVLLTRDGGVHVRGLALDAALAGRDDTDGRTASRVDATGLTALLYAGLTATWPLAGTDLTPAPRVGRGVMPPSELQGGIPADLDAAAVAGLGAPGSGPAIPADVAESLGAWSDRPVGRVVEAGPAADTEAPPAEATVPVESLPYELRGDVEHPPSKAAVAAAAVGGATAAASRKAAAKAQEAARQAAERAAERRRETQALREAEKAAERPFAQIAEEAPAEAEPVVPVLAKDVVTAVPSQRQGRFVLGFMAAFVVAALALASFGIFRMVDTINDKVAMGAGPAITRTVTAKPVTVTAKPGGGIIAAAPSPDGAVAPIVGVQVLDPPPGDGSENSAMVPRVFDGNLSTSWRSSTYKTTSFSGLKPGLGLVADLGQKTAIRSVELSVPEAGIGADVTLYLADAMPTTVADLAKLPKLASTTLNQTTTTLTAKSDLGEHSHVVVWYTKTAPDNRVYVSELKLTS